MLENRPSLLWVPLMAPYDNVRHAGGKIQNYYLKKLRATNQFNIKVVTTCKEDEIDFLDFEEYSISHEVAVRKRKGFSGLVYRGIAWISKANLFGKYGGLTPIDISVSMKKMLSKVAKEGFLPQIIVLGWTEILFLHPLIKKLFPAAKVVSIEEDVSFLGQERRAANAGNMLIRKFYSIKARKTRSLELRYLKQCDLVILNNRKDLALLEENGLHANTWVWTPFFQNMLALQRKKHINKRILFYGAMFREENWKSAEWFIQHVFPAIEEADVEFWVIGNNPSRKLLKYNGGRIHIVGFVESLSEFFEEALCMAAPLVLGAGVKIKVLEGFSAGLPVLTNHIGIEGISAKDGEDFFLCETPEQYVSVIHRLLSGEVDGQKIGENAKKLIRENYNYEKDADVFIAHMHRLLITNQEKT